MSWIVPFRSQIQKIGTAELCNCARVEPCAYRLSKIKSFTVFFFFLLIKSFTVLLACLYYFQLFFANEIGGVWICIKAAYSGLLPFFEIKKSSLPFLALA